MLNKRGVQPGQKHIWEFLANDANRHATIDAGPLVANKKAVVETYYEYEQEQLDNQLPWWKLDHGPDVDGTWSPYYEPKRERQSE